MLLFSDLRRLKIKCVLQKNLILSYLATLEASETTEDVLERREELEDVCPIGNAHLTMVSNQERF